MLSETLCTFHAKLLFKDSYSAIARQTKTGVVYIPVDNTRKREGDQRAVERGMMLFIFCLTV